MKYQECQSGSPDDARSCIGCASPMESHCLDCGAITAATGEFCKECAYDLKKPKKSRCPPIDFNEPHSSTLRLLIDKILIICNSIQRERKLVTVPQLAANLRTVRISSRYSLSIPTRYRGQQKERR